MATRSHSTQPWAAGALIVLLVATALAGAWAFQDAGYAPCELCLKERLPYYVGIPVAVVTTLVSRRGLNYWALVGFVILLVAFAASAAVGLYHVGVEWQFWPGPSECSGSMAPPPDVADFMKQLQHVAVVRCDQPALKILGLSLAGWNVVVSVAAVALANVGILRTGSTRSWTAADRR